MSLQNNNQVNTNPLIDISLNKPNLANILLLALNTDTLTIKLTPTEIEYIHNIINNDPQLLYNIGDSINSIISDGKIDLHDIPKIILLMSQIYKSNCIKNINIINIVKFTLDCILEFKYLPLPNVEIIIIKSIIDNSLDLLSLNIDLVKETNKNIWYYLCLFFTPWKIFMTEK